ncbi:MAG: hypothetical protein R3C99_19020 [Pirellulaceae bacterium]
MIVGRRNLADGPVQRWRGGLNRFSEPRIRLQPTENQLLARRKRCARSRIHFWAGATIAAGQKPADGQVQRLRGVQNRFSAPRIRLQPSENQLLARRNGCAASKTDFWAGAMVARLQKRTFGRAQPLRRFKNQLSSGRNRCAAPKRRFAGRRIASHSRATSLLDFPR